MLIVLIGPKGSGKSYIGRLLESKLGICFFHVEPHWIRYHAECAATSRPISIKDGIKRVHPLISEALQAYEHVCVETTGASPAILDDLLAIGERFSLLLVRVEAPLQLCLERIARRDQTDQIPMQEDDIREVHTRSRALDLPFDIVLENIDLTEEQILSPFRAVGMGKA